MVTVGKVYKNYREYEKDNYYLKTEDGKALDPEKIGKGREELGVQGITINEEAYKALKEGRDPSTGEHLVQKGVNGEHRGGYNFTFSPDKSFTVYAHTSKQNRRIVQDIHNKAMADVVWYFESDLAQCRYGHDGLVEPMKTGNILAMRVDHQVNREGDIQLHSHIVVFNQTYNPETEKWQALHSDAFHSDTMTKLYENQLAYYAQEAGLAVEWKVSDSGRSQYAAIAGVPEKAIAVTSERARQVDEYVKDHMDELKTKYPEASLGDLKQIAAIETRKDKVSMTREEIEAQLTEKLSGAGLTREAIAQGVQEKASEFQEQKIETVKMNEHEVLQQAAKSLTDYESAFSKQDLLKASCEISKGDVSITALQSGLKDMDKEIVTLAESHTRETRTASGRTISYNDQVYTTPEVLQAEKQAFRNVERGKGQVQAIMSKEDAQKAIDAYEKRHSMVMTPSQRGAVEFGLTSPDKYNAVQGYAGTGKTTVMQAFTEIAHENGYRVIGISETNVAVQEMKAAGVERTTTTVNEMKAAGMEAMTATKFLNDHKLHQGLNDKTIVISDESSFMGAKNFKAVHDVCEKTGARGSFWGDKEQLPPISAGFPFKELIDRDKINHVEVKDIIRQREGTKYHEAVKDIIDKKIDKSFEKVTVIEAKDNLHKETAKVYRDRDGYKNYIVSVATNADKDKLNTLIREDLKEQGKVSRKGETLTVWQNKNLSGTERFNAANYQVGDKLVSMRPGQGAVGKDLKIVSVDRQTHTVIVEGVNRRGEEYIRKIDIRRNGDRFSAYQPMQKEFAEGDKIIFTKTERKTGIANSEIAYLKSINPDGSITINKGGKEIKTTSRHFEHGYAATDYKAQGKTAQGAIYQAEAGKGQPDKYQEYYVSITRGKADAVIVTNDKEALKEQVARLAEKDSTFNYQNDLKKEIRATEKEVAEKGADPAKVEKLNALRDEYNRQKEAKEHHKDRGKDKAKEAKEVSKEMEIDKSKGRVKEKDGIEKIEPHKEPDRDRESLKTEKSEPSKSQEPELQKQRDKACEFEMER